MKFEDLIAPYSTDTFFSEIFEKQYLHIPGSPNRFNDLLDIAGLEKLLWQNESDIPRIVRVVKNGSTQLPSRRLRNEDHMKWAIRHYHAGHTLVVQHVEALDPHIAKSARTWEDELRCPVQANVFLTPPGSSGFRPHYDTHEVLVLQLEGEKHWNIYPDSQSSKVRLPLKRQAFDSNLGTPHGDPISTQLSPGDVLYVPRGVVHAAESRDLHSLHVTLGIRPPQWGEVVEAVIGECASLDVKLRQSLVVSKPSAKDCAHALRKMAEAVRNSGLGATALRGIDRDFVSKLRALPGNSLKSESDARLIQLDSMVVKRRGVPCHYGCDDGRAYIIFPGLGAPAAADVEPGRFEGPGFLLESFRLIAETNRPHKVANLASCLSDCAKVLLAQSLVRAGLLDLVKKGAKC